MENTLVKIVANVFGVSEETAADTEFFFDLDMWDSLKQLELMKAVQQEYDIKFDQVIIFQLLTKADVIDAINQVRSK